MKTSLQPSTNTNHRFVQSERRCDYHELAYATNGKPWSCINYNSSNSNNISNLYETVKAHANNPLESFKNTCYVHVEMIAAPYNPADALSIQGIYANPYHGNHHHHHQYVNVRPQGNSSNPYETIAQWSRTASMTLVDGGTTGTVPGSEGWGRIIDIQHPPNADTMQQEEDKVQLNIGDYVVLGQPGLGTYRSSMWLPSTSVILLPHGRELFDRYGPTIPAPLFQTAGTALRMLRDFCYTSPSSQPPAPTMDDSDSITIVQNAGNSAVGLMVSQIATKIMNHPCISIIRSNDRTSKDMDELQQYMMEYGNPTQIVTEENILKSNDHREHLAHHSPLYDASNIRLGLNAVGGDSIHTLLQMISSHQNNGGTGATIVTYGNMSKQPYLTIDPSHLIFRNIHFTGFWYSRWMVQQQYQQYLDNIHTSIATNRDDHHPQRSPDLRSLMMNEIVDAVLHRSLKCPPVQAFPLCDYKSAFEYSKRPSNIKPKIVFDCREMMST